MQLYEKVDLLEKASGRTIGNQDSGTPKQG